MNIVKLGVEEGYPHSLEKVLSYILRKDLSVFNHNMESLIMELINDKAKGWI